MNVNEEILQNREEENQNVNGSSKQPESAKKGTKKNPAKAKQINIRTEFLFRQKWTCQNAKKRNRFVVVKKLPLSLDVFQNRTVRTFFLFCLEAV